MKLFEGKSPTERNKIIAAVVLGVLSLTVLYLTFGRSLIGGSGTTTVKVSTAPKPSPTVNPETFTLPTKDQQDFDYATTEIAYSPDIFGTPDPGRNIFAFYEPPPPCRGAECPTPTIAPIVVVQPTPAPTPPILISFVTPQSIYAGSKAFRLEINGDKFTPDARIYFSQNELPTTFINAQKLVADVPAALIASAGPRQIIVQTLDGKFYSNQILLNIQAPPEPQFTYIGMIARKLANNDTAYFLEAGKPAPFAHRLNDVVAGRFRLLSISESETVFEDINLGFRHRRPLVQETGAGSQQPSRPGSPNRGGDGYVPPYNQGFPQNPQVQSIPGIPDNIPRYVPPNGARPTPGDKKDANDDVDDDGDGR